MCCSVLVIIFILVLLLLELSAYNFYNLMVLLNEYGDPPILFQNLSLHNINNPTGKLLKKNHSRLYFRGTIFILNEHKFLLDLTFSVNLDLSGCVVRLTSDLTSKVPPLPVREAKLASLLWAPFLSQLHSNSRLGM